MLRAGQRRPVAERGRSLGHLGTDFGQYIDALARAGKADSQGDGVIEIAEFEPTITHLLEVEFFRKLGVDMGWRRPVFVDDDTFVAGGHEADSGDEQRGRGEIWQRGLRIDLAGREGDPELPESLLALDDERGVIGVGSGN